MDLESAFEEGFDEDMFSNMTNYNGTTGVNYPTRVVLAIAFLIMTVVGIVGNVFVIGAVILSRRLQTPMNAFVVNLAVADLLACVTFPTQAASLLVGYPVWLCVITALMDITSLGCSLITITLIAINRFILITKTKNVYQKIYTPMNLGIMIVIAWVIGPLCMILASSRVCGVYLVKHGAGYLSWLVPILLITTLVIILVCYILIFLFIKRHVARSMATSKRLDISITKNLLYVVCAFYACVLPFTIVVSTGRFFIPPGALVTVETFFTVILYMNSVVNPIIYAARHPIFKPIFGYMIKRQWHNIPEPSRLAKSFGTDQRDGYSLDKSISSSVKTELTSAYV
ncbi:mu-type opioid receptor-like [Lytechinus pictus]|uniref:mu-type opioid receptor-like n=1 Tax=Lytechinus pictus TaxID=7653 RepID=UPI00240E19B9|nr:mu-type opioid receptor-like [Lytechinus pictus]